MTRDKDPITMSKLTQLPFGFAKRHAVLFDVKNYQSNQPVIVYCQKQASLSLRSELRRYAESDLDFKRVDAYQFQQIMSESYDSDASQSRAAMEDIGATLNLPSLAESMSEAEDLLEQSDDAPIIRLLNVILAEAIQAQASDIHLETFDKSFSVRFRIDGILKDIATPRRELAGLLISRVKVMAQLDIAEKRLPQDGRISLRLGGREVDVRVSTLPSIHGERIVLRLLDKSDKAIQLNALGMDHGDRQRLQALLLKTHGILLVTGPTGSGKTTTLYAALNHINDREKNILTVEDPVEYHIEGIGQTQVNQKAGMTFAKGLRAILRQDPDIVMVGEIGDIETMQIATQASLTGHLVLSTLHTNSAAGAITRRMDMGMEPFLLASSLVGVLAQRLVRKLCPECKQPYTPSATELAQFTNTPLDREIYRQNVDGCPHCNQQGYKGRTGIYEWLAPFMMADFFQQDYWASGVKDYLAPLLSIPIQNSK